MKYRTCEPIKWDAAIIAVGSEIDLTDEAAAPLLASGAIEPIGEKPFALTTGCTLPPPVAQDKEGK